jgi:cellulose synthase/poly-beta-1,6-N-acetylglucosamine synthase-like glycosyltransferase
MLVFIFILITIFICLNVIAYSGLLTVDYESQTTAIFPNTESQHASVSVIVAARNEAMNLPSLLASILSQTHRNLEVIIVSDRSSDETPDVVRLFDDHRLRLIEIRETPRGLSSKKFALAAGIRAAKGDILFLTDADCSLSERWISDTLKCFDARTAVVVGYAPFRKRTNESFIEMFQRYECVRTAMLTAGAIGRKKPYMATGRNLAYRKEVFESVGGFDAIRHIQSGDDDLLLQRIVRKTKMKVKYFVSPATAVVSEPQPNLTAFINQKSRHFSDAFHYDLFTILFLGFYHAINFFMVFLLPFQWILASPSLYVGIRMFHAEDFRWRALYLEPLYAVYAFVAPALAFRKFEWKA